MKKGYLIFQRELMFALKYKIFKMSSAEGVIMSNSTETVMVAAVFCVCVCVCVCVVQRFDNLGYKKLVLAKKAAFHL